MGTHELRLQSKFSGTYVNTRVYLDHDASFTELDYVLSNGME